jgi:hypothetical protein
MTLPSGNWDIDGNGFRGTLTINGVDDAGNLNASVVFESSGVQHAIGFWDEPSQKITFVRVINPDDPSPNQIYTAFRFDNERDHLTDHTHTLAGYFEAFQGAGDSYPTVPLFRNQGSAALEGKADK